MIKKIKQLEEIVEPTLKYLNTKSKEELCYLLFVDKLTKTYNRNMFEELRKQFSSIDAFITIFDIDNLKIINDTKGHTAGDKHIKNIVNKIKQNFGQNKFWMFRLGGDEFLTVSKVPVIFKVVGVSYGTVYKPANLALNTAMKTADLFMYENKKFKINRKERKYDY